MTTCIVVNKSRHITSSEVVRVCSAVNKWSKGVSQVWDVPQVILLPGSLPQGTGSTASFGVILLQDGLDVAGAAGYHDVYGGRPIGKVDISGTIDAGMSWSVTLCHELAEMMVDPWCFSSSQYARDSWIALEVGDPVEDDRFGMQIDGVLCSDYVLPAYFAGGSGPYDAMRLLKSPAPALLPGGYASVCVNGNWSQISPPGEQLAPRGVNSRRHELRVALSDQIVGV